MKSLILLILAFVASFTASAQVINKAIGGVVKDSQNEFFLGATVSLLNANDSMLVQGTATDLYGEFEFENLDNGTYYLEVSSIGNNRYKSIPITIDDQNTNIAFPVIILSPSTTMLEEVITEGKRPLIEQDIDKTIVNVDAMMGSAGINTLEVLERTPGVTIGTEGEINLNGQGEVLVLIDDRPTYLSRQDLTLYLKSLPGGSLDKIELITNPPAKYDAAGSSIINIRLKKNRLQGLTGNITLSYNQGVTSRSHNVVNLNYNHKRMNLFGNIGYSKDGNYGEDIYDRRFNNDDSSLNSSVSLVNNYRYRSHAAFARLGIDYTASPKTIFGFLVNFQNRPSQDWLDYTSYSYNAAFTLDSLGQGSSYGTYEWRNLGTNLNFEHRFNEEGREISADLNYIHYKSFGEQELSNFTTLEDDRLLDAIGFLYLLPSDITIYAAQADYTHPLKDNARFEVGIKSSLVENNSRADYFDVVGNMNIPDYGRSNHFIYREIINAAYISARKNWKKTAVQGGIRLENTWTSGEQLGNFEVEGSSSKRNYTGIFPTVAFQYKIDSAGSTVMTISLARRINRPNYDQLNPFLFYHDNHTFNSGNPALNPQYNHIGEIKYQYKQSLGIRLRYGYFTDLISTTTQAVDNIFITRPGNIANGTNIAITTNLSLLPTKWWSLNADITFAHLSVEGNVYSESLNSKINPVRVNLHNQFIIDDSWSGELIGFYESRNMGGQTISGQRYRVNASLQKEILQEKATIRVMVEDIFHSWKEKNETLGLNQAESFHTNETDTQRIGLAFTYRFGKDRFTRTRKHSDNAANEEKGRVEE